MRKNIFGKRLSRNKNQRQALFKNLITSLITYGRIKTTHAKSLAVKGLVDKVVTAAKEDTLAKRRFLLSLLPKNTVEKLIQEVAPRFTTRTSGFTRIVKAGTRLSDNAPVVIMQWTDEAKTLELIKEPKKKIEKAPEAQKKKAKTMKQVKKRKVVSK